MVGGTCVSRRDRWSWDDDLVAGDGCPLTRHPCLRSSMRFQSLIEGLVARVWLLCPSRALPLPRSRLQPDCTEPFARRATCVGRAAICSGATAARGREPVAGASGRDRGARPERSGRLVSQTDRRGPEYGILLIACRADGRYGPRSAPSRTWSRLDRRHNPAEPVAGTTSAAGVRTLPLEAVPARFLAGRASAPGQAIHPSQAIQTIKEGLGPGARGPVPRHRQAPGLRRNDHGDGASRR